MNTLFEKTINPRELCLKTSIDVLCIDEAKLSSSYPNAQFHIQKYQFPLLRKDRIKNRGGTLVYVKDGIVAKRLETLEWKHSKKWCVITAYRPPSNKKVNFFSKLRTSLSQIKNTSDNIIIMERLNIDTSDITKDASNNLSGLRDTSSLQNKLIEHVSKRLQKRHY